MDFLQEGAVFLADTMKAHVSRKITYKRGNASVEIDATVGRHPTLIEGAGGQLIESVGRDYLFLKTDLLLLPTLTEPERGDTIEDVDGEWEVMNPMEGVPEWRFNDSREVQIRVHTKRVKA